MLLVFDRKHTWPQTFDTGIDKTLSRRFLIMNIIQHLHGKYLLKGDPALKAYQPA